MKGNKMKDLKYLNTMFEAYEHDNKNFIDNNCEGTDNEKYFEYFSTCLKNNDGDVYGYFTDEENNAGKSNKEEALQYLKNRYGISD